MTLRSVLSWLVGVLAIVAIAWVFRPQGFVEALLAFDLAALAGWLTLTLLARAFLAGTTVLPLRALGFEMSAVIAFWIGWVRTFSSLLLPLSGIAAYAKLVRARVGISWSELASLTAPQFVLAVAALGIIGLAATASNFQRLGTSALAIAGFFFVVIAAAIAAASSAGWLIRLLPEAVSTRLARTSAALRTLARTPGLLAQVVVLHAIGIVLRGARLWFVFEVVGVTLDWPELLLMIAIAESTMLVNLTPGGLGIREGLVVGGAVLLQIGAPVAASAALIDRVLTFALATLLAIPAFLILRRPADRST